MRKSRITADLLDTLPRIVCCASGMYDYHRAPGEWFRNINFWACLVGFVVQGLLFRANLLLARRLRFFKVASELYREWRSSGILKGMEMELFTYLLSHPSTVGLPCTAFPEKPSPPYVHMSLLLSTSKPELPILLQDISDVLSKRRWKVGKVHTKRPIKGHNWPKGVEFYAVECLPPIEDKALKYG